MPRVADNRQHDADRASDTERLRALDDRLARARGEPRTAAPEGYKYRQANQAWRMVIELVAGLGIGFGIGFGLDHLFGTSPILLVVFILLGFVAGVKTMLRTAAEMARLIEEARARKTSAAEDATAELAGARVSGDGTSKTTGDGSATPAGNGHRPAAVPDVTPHRPTASAPYFDYLIVGAGFAGAVVAERLASQAGKRVLVAGYADDQGRPDRNLKLSIDRASAVRDWLVEASGIPPTQFAIQGYGYTRPVADNATPEGRAKNRRVEITLVPDTQVSAVPTGAAR